MDPVKLANAYNTELDRFFHISEKIEYRNYLICPFCKQHVGVRKGKIRRHHFYHKSTNEIKCSATSETLLHEGAKIYVYKKLLKNESFKILIDVDEISEPVIQNHLRALNIEELVISSNGVNSISQNEYSHYLEKSIPPYRPDVFSESNNNNESLAWEIYVTHFIEEDKINFFIERKIPFLEMEPVEDGESDYIFKVKRQFGIKFLNDFSKIGYLLFKNYQGSLLTKYKKELRSKYVRRIESKLKKKILAELLDLLKYSHSTFLQEKNFKSCIEIANSFHTTIRPRHRGEYEDCIRYEVCSDLRFEQKNDISIIKLNNKYSFDSPFFMIGEIYRSFCSQDVGEALLNNEDKVVGFLLKYPNLKTSKIKKAEIILDKEHSETSIQIFESIGKRTRNNNKPYLIMNDKFFVTKPLTQLMNISEYLSENFRLKLVIQKSKFGECVTGLNVVGLVNIIKLNEALIENVFPAITQRLQ